MNKSFLTLLITCLAFCAHAQTVTTYAGKVNSDPFANYETVSADLDDTYFSMPEGLCFDEAGRLYISERNKVRIVTNNKAYIRAGSLAQPSMSEGYRNNTGTQATFRVPGGMISDDDGNIYVADAQNHAIRKITMFVNVGNGQVVSTFAGKNAPGTVPGNGEPGSVDGTGTAARFNTPRDICIDSSGYMYVTDELNFTIRKISPTGVVTTLAGSAGNDGQVDGNATTTRFGGPWGIAMLDDNNLVVSDPWNGNIRKVNIFSGQTTTIAGSTTGPDSRIVNGTLSEARFKKPKGIAVVNGIIYVGDQNVIRAIDVSGNSVTTFAGDENTFSVQNGTGSSASFTEISDIVHDGMGNIFIAENSNAVPSSVIRKMTLDNLAPVADFTVSEQSAAVNEEVILTDASSGQTPTSYQWNIDKSSYTVSTNSMSDASVGVKFTATGFYGVSLTIVNDYGNDTETKNNYISVSTTGSVETYQKSDLVNVYPNPANDVVTMNLDASLPIASTGINLYDASGRHVFNMDGMRQFSTSNLENGVYFITVVNKNIKIAKRLVVAH